MGLPATDRFPEQDRILEEPIASHRSRARGNQPTGRSGPCKIAQPSYLLGDVVVLLRAGREAGKKKTLPTVSGGQR
jgi:hypothetical protein